MDTLGIATKIKDLDEGNGWHKGTSLYKISPPICNRENEQIEYIIVAVSPKTVDYGQPETKCFAATEDGGIFEDRNIDDKNIDLTNGTFIGAYNHKAALEQIGYKIDGNIEYTNSPNYILSTVNDEIISIQIENKMFEIVRDNIFIENETIWKLFFKYSTFSKINLKNSHKNFGCDAFQIKGIFWNEDFSSKNGDAILYIYIDPQNRSIVDYSLESAKLKIINKSEENKKGCIFSLFGLMPIILLLKMLII